MEGSELYIDKYIQPWFEPQWCSVSWSLPASALHPLSSSSCSSKFLLKTRVKNIIRKSTKRLEVSGISRWSIWKCGFLREAICWNMWRWGEFERTLYIIGREAHRQRAGQLDAQRLASLGSLSLCIIVSVAYAGCLAALFFYILYWLYVWEGDIGSIIFILWIALAIVTPYTCDSKASPRRTKPHSGAQASGCVLPLSPCKSMSIFSIPFPVRTLTSFSACAAPISSAFRHLYSSNTPSSLFR